VPTAIQSQVLAANASFYEALERLDLNAILSCWDSTGPVACAHPGSGWAHGWEQLTQSWSAIVTNTEYLEFEIVRPIVTTEDPVAWVACTEMVTSGAQGNQVHGQMAALNLFVLTRQGWRLRLHQASPVLRTSDDDDES
jgi:ketosteroid isomerase-like protein